MRRAADSVSGRVSETDRHCDVQGESHERGIGPISGCRGIYFTEGVHRMGAFVSTNQSMQREDLSLRSLHQASRTYIAYPVKPVTGHAGPTVEELMNETRSVDFKKYRKHHS